MDINIIEQLKITIHSITSISDEEFDQSIRLLQHVRIEKGKHFVEAGKICDKIAFIGKGILRTYTRAYGYQARPGPANSFVPWCNTGNV